jgi:hypothetical protein
MVINIKQQIQLEPTYRLASHSHRPNHQTSLELWRNRELLWGDWSEWRRSGRVCLMTRRRCVYIVIMPEIWLIID